MLLSVLLALAVIIVTARIVGAIFSTLNQPAVIGELIAGVLLGVSAFDLVPVHSELFEFLSEMGVVVLLFEPSQPLGLLRTQQSWVRLLRHRKEVVPMPAPQLRAFPTLGQPLFSVLPNRLQ